MKSYEIRKRFLEFFKVKSHEIIPSDRLVPMDDPTLLFTSAGMTQFKEEFLGRNITYKRAASCQKCLRTGDLENVGKTRGHHTFFEMLGNFSFGDYFKKEACLWAWEFMTDALKIPKEKLWVSVYKDDDEAYKIWLEDIKVPAGRIVRFGAKENFWPSNAPTEGPNGPCGPCSEIFYDRGRDTGCGKKTCGPSCGCGRFVEVWNLVFTQFNRAGMNDLKSLPSKNIDTGMGLERITAVMQGVGTNFETDLFVPIIEKIRSFCPGLMCPKLNAIADHARAAVFAICDGVSPSNEERGYVVRKLIRRAYLYGGINKPFLYNLVPKITEIMRDVYPELKARREDIAGVIKEEEEKFRNTLTAALPRLEEVISERRKDKRVTGDKIFRLVDTYGLPIEVIEEVAEKNGYSLDMAGFNDCMEKQKELSRDKSKIERDIFAGGVFSGAGKSDYSDKDPLKARVAFIVVNKKETKSAKTEEKASIVTDPSSSAFYAESGGQVGDSGSIKKAGGRVAADIINTFKVGESLVHECVIKEDIKKGDEVIIERGRSRNEEIAKNHTATHLLHAALRKVLGGHVRQAGSLVTDDRLRFDFTHMKKLTESQIERAEGLVNEKISEAIAVKKEIKTKKDAEEEGAMALFGEKYGQSVRVVSIGDYSKELCGGSHVENTRDIGIFKIIRESSIASGTRRIEALTGERARIWAEERKRSASEKEKSEKIKEEAKKREKEKLTDIVANIGAIIKKGALVSGVKVIAEEIEGANMNTLRRLADTIKQKEKPSFVALAGKEDDKAFIVLTVTDDLVKKGIDASSIIREAAALISGSGGGRKDFAQAGGKDTAKIKEALESAKRIFTDKWGGSKT